MMRSKKCSSLKPGNADRQAPLYEKGYRLAVPPLSVIMHRICVH